MFIELLGTLFAGVACAGIAMFLNIVTGRRLPKWVMPVAAGLGMIAMTISNEYTWYSRTADRLPDGIEIAVTVEQQGWNRPWTMIWPYVKRFAAVDIGTMRTHQDVAGQHIADLYFFGRWSPVNQAPVLFDCTKSRSALLIDGATFAQDGTLANADWQDLPADDPMLKLICVT